MIKLFVLLDFFILEKLMVEILDLKKIIIVIREDEVYMIGKYKI